MHLIERHGLNSWIIAKIEDQSAISHLKAIIEVSDMLMIARGDLAIESPFEELPIAQSQAEITDVATAVQQRADCVLLYGMEPFLCESYEKHTEFLGDAVQRLYTEHRVQSGDGLVAINYAASDSAHHDTIQLYQPP